MPIGSSLLVLVTSLSGQVAKPTAPKPCPETATQRLKLHAKPLSPRDMLRAMLALDQTRRSQPGATVEVIGTDDEAALKLLSMKVRDQVHREFRSMDKRGHQELYAFMQQDPSRPSPVLFVPRLPGP